MKKDPRKLSFGAQNRSLAAWVPVVKADTVISDRVGHACRDRLHLLRAACQGGKQATEALLKARWAEEPPEARLKAAVCEFRCNLHGRERVFTAFFRPPKWRRDERWPGIPSLNSQSQIRLAGELHSHSLWKQPPALTTVPAPPVDPVARALGEGVGRLAQGALDARAAGPLTLFIALGVYARSTEFLAVLEQALHESYTTGSILQICTKPPGTGLLGPGGVAHKPAGKGYQQSTLNSVRVMEIAQKCLLVTPAVSADRISYDGNFLATLGLGALVNDHAGAGDSYLAKIEVDSGGRVAFADQNVEIETPGSDSSKSKLFQTIFGISNWQQFAGEVRTTLRASMLPNLAPEAKQDAETIISSITEVSSQSWACKTGQRMAAQLNLDLRRRLLYRKTKKSTVPAALVLRLG